MTSIANKLDTANTPANAVANPDSLLTMPKTTSVEQDTQESHALAFTIYTVLALLTFTGIVGAVIFLVKKIRQAVGVQWHPELGEFEEPKKGFKKAVRVFPEVCFALLGRRTKHLDEADKICCEGCYGVLYSCGTLPVLP